MTTVDSSPGYPVTTTTGEPPAGSIDSAMTVGAGFDEVRSVLIDPAGGVWVLDRGARRIAHYDHRGTETATVGKVGTGDGGFADPYSLAWGGGDLMVYDPGNSRVGRWAPSGEWRGAWRAVPITGGTNARFFPSGSSSSAWLFQFSFLSNGQPAPGFARFPLTPRGDVRWVPPTERRAVQGMVICRTGGAPRTFATPFTHGELWQPSIDGHLLYVHGSEYAIATVDSVGDTLRVVRRTLPVLAISDSEWVAASAELERYRTANPGSCDGGFMRPGARPAVRAITLDDRGRTWVERARVGGFGWEVWRRGPTSAVLGGIDRDPAVPIRHSAVIASARSPSAPTVDSRFAYSASRSRRGDGRTAGGPAGAGASLLDFPRPLLFGHIRRP